MSGGWKSAELADKIRDGEVDANIEAVLSDEKELGDVMLACERGDVDDDEDGLYALLARQSGTDSLRGARKTGDSTTMNAATGLNESRVEATGLGLLINSLRAAADQGVIRGQKGTGKTGAATRTGMELVRDGVVDKVALNYPVRGMTKADLERAAEISRVPDWWLDPDENARLGDLEGTVRFCVDISEFLEFAKESGEKLAVFDEFSSSGNAYTNQSDVEQVMGRVINAFRKSPNGSLRTLYIGHQNDSDIHPIVRKQSDVVISKDGKADEGMADMATLYETWKDYLKGDSKVKIRGLPDVPKGSAWRYPSNYFAHLEWDLDDPENQLPHGNLIDDWEQYQEDDDTDDPEAGEEQLCEVPTKSGGQCPQTAQFPKEDPVACHGHRGKLAQVADDDEASETSEPPETPPVGDVASGLQDTFSALNAARGASEGDEEDERLIADSLASKPDVNREEAERIASELINNDDGDD